MLYEGELLKFRPAGENSSWIERWCKVTPTAIVFYDSDLNNQCWDVTPTMVVPIGDILSVLRVNCDLTTQNSSQHQKKDYQSGHYKYDQIFQFEIFTEWEEYPYKEEIECEILNQNELVEENKRRKAKREMQKVIDASPLDRSRRLSEFPQQKLLMEIMPQIPRNVCAFILRKLTHIAL